MNRVLILSMVVVGLAVAYCALQYGTCTRGYVEWTHGLKGDVPHFICEERMWPW